MSYNIALRDLKGHQIGCYTATGGRIQYDWANALSYAKGAPFIGVNRSRYRRLYKSVCKLCASCGQVIHTVWMSSTGYPTVYQQPIHSLSTGYPQVIHRLKEGGTPPPKPPTEPEYMSLSKKNYQL